MVPLMDEMSLRVMTGRDIGVGLAQLTLDIQVFPDVFPVMFVETAAVPMPLPVVVNTGSHNDIRRETAPAVVPLAEEMTLRVTTVSLSDNGSDCPAELLNSESVCCVVDDGVFVPELSPVVSARGAVVPTSLPTISEVFSSAVLAGGGGVVAAAAPLAVVGTVTARVSVLPDVGSELPVDPDVAAMVCAALLEEAVDSALDVVGVNVGQLWFRTDPEDALPVMLDEHSLMCDLVWLDVVPVIQDVVSTDVCGDDRFSPGVRSNNVSLDWWIDLDSHGIVNWECQLNGEDRVLAGASDWRSVLHCIALMSCLPEFPDIDCPKCSDDIGRNCIMDFSAGGTCPRVRTPGCGLKTFAQTLPTRQECLVNEKSSGGGVARMRGCAWMRGCAEEYTGEESTKIKSTEEESTGVDEIGCAEDWGYIRPVTDGEWPVCVQPVTGSLLFRSPLRRELGLPQPHLPSGGLSWTILADLCFSCRTGR